VLTSILGEPAKQSADTQHADLMVTAASTPTAPGEFQYDLGAQLPIDRVNLDLPDLNTIVDVDLLSREHPGDPWHEVTRSGFYRLKSDADELRNGSIPIARNSDRYWLIRTDPKRGGLGKSAPRFRVEWVPQELVFVARGSGPFSLAYGSAAAESASTMLGGLPKNVAIIPATLGAAEVAGGDAQLHPVTQLAWKTPLLWSVLIAGAALLAWMAYRLSKEVARP